MLDLVGGFSRHQPRTAEGEKRKTKRTKGSSSESRTYCRRGRKKKNRGRPWARVPHDKDYFRKRTFRKSGDVGEGPRSRGSKKTADGSSSSMACTKASRRKHPVKKSGHTGKRGGGGGGGGKGEAVGLTLQTAEKKKKNDGDHFQRRTMQQPLPSGEQRAGNPVKSKLEPHLARRES